MGFRISGFGFRVLGFRVSGFGFWVSGLSSRVSDFGIRISDFGFLIEGLDRSTGVRQSGQRSAPPGCSEFICERVRVRANVCVTGVG